MTATAPEKALFYVSAAHKSSGKTTVSIGLCAALSARGLVVRPYKKGPDYIDPMWLTRAAGHACHNLDFNTQSPAEIQAEFTRRMRGADVGLVEGNKGLFDGVDLGGSDCNAALAKLLDLPVVLVLDVQGVTRGVAPLLLGYNSFDPEVKIAGVILNRVRKGRHEEKVVAAVERYTDIPVFGCVASDPKLEIRERHLGLVPSNEYDAASEQVGRLGEALEAQVDIDRILVATSTTSRAFTRQTDDKLPASDVRIGIAMDAAFGFYYAGDLEAFARAGARLIPFDTLNDPAPPEMDGLFLGGGFPENFLQQLEANRPMREAVRQRISQGLPTYAECGGLMYLSRAIHWGGNRGEMVGTIVADTVVNQQPVGRGLVKVEPLAQLPWSPRTTDGPIAAHEFHYSTFKELLPGREFGYKVIRGHGVDGENDGLMQNRLLANYTHLRDTESCRWVEPFVQYVRECLGKSGPA